MIKAYCDICKKEVKGGYIMVFKKYKYLNRVTLVDPDLIKHGVVCEEHYEEIQSYIHNRQKELKSDEVLERE